MSTIYTFEEIEQHNKSDDLWMVIDGKVYDCTSYLDEHPGGEEVVVDCAGTDATGPFDDIGHSDDAREILEGLLIGVLDPASVASSASKTTSSVSGGDSSSQLPLILAVIVALAGMGFYFYTQ